MIDFSTIEKEVVFSAVRSRGPGGQNVNKVSSAAVLTWDFSASSALSSEQKRRLAVNMKNTINKSGLIHLRSDEFRDLPRNKARCLEKLRDHIAIALHKPKKRKKTQPTQASRKRRRETKQQRGDIKKMRQKVKY